MTPPSGDQRGILYIAQGERYLKELRFAAESAKKAMPNVQRAAMTNSRKTVEEMELFDIILPLDNTPFSWQKRIDALQRTPFERTLFLDTDTYICGNINELFQLLDRFDIGVAQAVIKHSPCRNLPAKPYIMPNVPETFPEVCCGLLLFRRNDRVNRLFISWNSKYDAQMASPILPFHDQPSFGEALYESDARVAILPTEYHCWITAGGYLSGPVCILHGHADDLPMLAEKLNRVRGPRVFWFARGHLFTYPTRNIWREVSALLKPGRLLALLKCGFKSTRK